MKREPQLRGKSRRGMTFNVKPPGARTGQPNPRLPLFAIQRRSRYALFYPVARGVSLTGRSHPLPRNAA